MGSFVEVNSRFTILIIIIIYEGVIGYPISFHWLLDEQEDVIASAHILG